MKPEVYIIRSGMYEFVTLGNLFVMEDNTILYQCKTLELPWRNNSRKNSCVPAGRYRMKYEYSSHFREKLWELKDVPGRTEIKIHVANYVRQLKGCIAVGDKIAMIDWDDIPDITNSRKTLMGLHDALREEDEVYINIYGQTS